MLNLDEWESWFRSHISTVATADDPAHDLLHFERVVATAKNLCHREGARPDVVIPAAWLHDLVIVPKNDPRRNMASRLSADAAVAFLKERGYLDELLPEIAHAVEAHSFSANIPCRTLEAKIVQDADRLDGLGAIGVARCFATAGILKRPFYSEQDPLCKSRPPQDKDYTLDHFFQKLFKTAETMQTASGRQEGQRRAEFMRAFLDRLSLEISPL